MKRNTIVLGVLMLVLVAASGAFAAQKYVITSSTQIKPGTISYANLSPAARARLAGKPGATGGQGPKGDAGAAGATGAPGPKGAAGGAGAKGDPGATGPAGADGTNALARASGLVAWTNDPAQILDSRADGNGTVHGASVVLSQGQVITSLAELVAAPGVGMTTGMFAIYDKNLNLVATTANTPAAFEVTNQWVELPLTTPYTVPTSDRYYFADLLATATTMPSIGNDGFNSATSARSILPGGVPRSFFDGPGLSAFPTPLTASSSGISRTIVAR